MLTRVRVFLSALGPMLFGLAAATTVAAQTGTLAASNTTTNTSITYTTTQLVEWDLPAAMDLYPGAVQVDHTGRNSGLWFVTRQGAPRVLHFLPTGPAQTTNAQWTSWSLDPNIFTTGGTRRFRARDDWSSVFARTEAFVQRIDTGSCSQSLDPTTGLPVLDSNNNPVVLCDRYTYHDSTACTLDANLNLVCPPMISDLALDRDGNLFTALSNDTTNSFIEMVEPNLAPDPDPAAPPDSYLAYGKTWQVGGGAGHCQGGVNTPCLSGIAVQARNSNLIYYSEPDGNNIGELDTCSNTVRRWSLTEAFGTDTSGNPIVYQPRQLNIDDDGDIWVVTGSGHLVSLDPQQNLMTLHAMPDGSTADPFGVAPDGFIGYTTSDLSSNKVAMLVPAGKTVYVCPHPACVPVNCVTIKVTKDQSQRLCGQKAPNPPKTVVTQVTSKPDGIFVEAEINNTNDSFQPMGITPHPGRGVGAFYYAVGHTKGDGSIIRVGLVHLPRPHLKAHHEREDKDCNDDGSNQDDEDHDGIPNQYKTSDSQAHADRENGQLGAGQSSDFTVVAGPNTKALVAVITADNPTAPLSVQVFDPSGLSVVVPIATPGIAAATIVPTVPGNYTVRVKNEGLTAINHETMLINREPLQLP